MKQAIAHLIHAPCAQLLLAILCSTTLLPSVVAADEIRIPVGQQGLERGLSLPQRGSSQDSVLSRFGEPQEKHAPVGQPPISIWHYADFTVYFEKDRVIHAVLNPPATSPAAQ